MKGMICMNDMKKIISQNLITLRNQNHYSLEYFADQIGVSRQAISKWETEKHFLI